MAPSTFAFIFFAGLLASGFSRPEEDKKDVFAAIAKKCNEHIKAPESAIEHLLHKDKLDDSKEGKCLLECTLKGLGLLTEDGHFNKEKGTEFIHKGWKKSEDQEKVQKIMEECFAKFNKLEDHCEEAYEFYECFEEEVHKDNIPEPFAKDH